MKLVIGSDHAGFDLKESLAANLRGTGVCDLLDVGTYNRDPVDYPDFRRGCRASYPQWPGGPWNPDLRQWRWRIGSGQQDERDFRRPLP